MKKFLLILLLSFSFAGVVSAERDVANHAFVASAMTKVVDATVQNDAITFWIMTGIFIGKELLDLDKTGFSINDLVYDYFGYNLVMFELKF
jgi:hypothetical protein